MDDRAGTGGDLTVRPLPGADVPAAARVLVRAFAGDPILTDLLRSPDDAIGHPAFFRSVLHQHLDGGHVYGGWDAGGLAGVAIWNPPTPFELSDASALAVELENALLARLYPQGVEDIEALFGRLGPLHPTAPHWYLAFVGVDAGRQGSGIGKRMLAPVLAAADAGGLDCYLETPASRTHAFYRAQGFEIERELMPFPRLDYQVWTMRRPPRPRDR